MGIHGNRYVRFAARIASLLVYVVPNEGVAYVVLVAINMVARFLVEVMLRIDFLVGVFVALRLHLDVSVLPLEGRDDLRVYFRLARRVVVGRLLSGILGLRKRGHGEGLSKFEGFSVGGGGTYRHRCVLCPGL